MAHHVLVTRDLGDWIEPLYQYAEVEVLKDGFQSAEELIDRLQGKDALLTTVVDPVGEVVIEACHDLEIISNYGVGYNHIDIEAATKHNILVTNTPDVLTEATADLTWALLLDVARRVSEGDRLVRKNQWQGWTPRFLLGLEVSHKTLGIIGMGRIGQAVAKRAIGFGMKILYYSRTRLPKKVEENLGAMYVSLETLLKESDFVSLHTPYTKATHYLIDEEQLRLMKESAFLINTSRGAVVNEQALIHALAKGWIRGAGLDVYEHEPTVPKELLAMEQVVLAPHLGSATEETRHAMAKLAVENLIAYFKNEKPRYIVNEEVWNQRRKMD